jgi:hypothetical protein
MSRWISAAVDVKAGMDCIEGLLPGIWVSGSDTVLTLSFRKQLMVWLDGVEEGEVCTGSIK